MRKAGTSRRGGLRLLGLLLMAGQAAGVMAHPDNIAPKVQSREANPGGPTPAAPRGQAADANAQQRIPSEPGMASPGPARAPASPLAGAGAGATPRKPWLHEQRKLGYKSSIGGLAAQAVHGHWPDERDLVPRPVEIWFVSTTRRIDANTVRYCVAPRVENPANRVWQRDFEVRLFQHGIAPPLGTARVGSEVPAWASRELQTTGTWCVDSAQGRNPRLIVDTDHGSANVAFAPVP